MHNLIFDRWGCVRGVWFVAMFCAAIFGIGYGVYCWSAADRAEMVKQHCSRTGAQRESMYIQYIYGEKGNIIYMYPVFYTEYEYKCDDYNRWRS